MPAWVAAWLLLVALAFSGSWFLLAFWVAIHVVVAVLLAVAEHRDNVRQDRRKTL